eukprot:gnl/TRDRNA2_/TRDRNA2_189734_c0_seq1.p1 gnl/TRDRNA2_/TRDRNA2_189734_c0~~gnl/TRDRNA2_/TRDRNA2_189734_c0_seq1.p1  ORF type:complete len:452 (+),score=105.62 gnl/TRDRNA2_/TRDRNA2_189734_c0_seq1:62-1417(+)
MSKLGGSRIAPGAAPPSRLAAVSKDDTKRMEDEARKMEAKLEMLRQAMDAGASQQGSAGPKWRSGSASKPLTRGYIKQVSEAPPKRAAPKRDPASGPPSGRGVEPNPLPTFGQLLTSGTGTPAAAVQVSPSSASPGNRAAANLQGALSQQTEEAAAVEAFLGSLSLDRYVSLFMEHGFDCMDVVKEMQESHMQEIGMATGHILKLRKKLSELSGTTEVAAEAKNQTQRRVSFGGTETKVRSPRPSSGSQAAGGGSLLDGQYDEAEAQSAFQEAVKAWREGREPRDVSRSKDDESTATGAAPKATGGSFWSSLGDSGLNIASTASSPVGANTSCLLGSDAKSQDSGQGVAPGDDKLCCYQCYKQFWAKFAVERASREPNRPVRLCSEVCAERYSAAVAAKEAELQKRAEQVAKMEEMQRILEQEKRVAEEAAAAAAEAQAAAEVGQPTAITA